MAQLPVAVQLASLRLPFKKALVLAAQLGADAVEIDARGELRPHELGDTALRQLRKMLDELRLKISTVSFRTRRGYEVLDDLDRRIEATKKALDFAYALGASTVVNEIGTISASEDSLEWSTMVEAVHDLGRYGQRCGAFLSARTGYSSGAELARLLDALPNGYLGIDLDPGGLIVHGHSVEEATSLLASHILHVHARDAVPDLAAGRGLEVPLGRGSVDFPNLLATLEAQDYRGYLTVQRNDSPTAVQEIGDAVQFLRNL